MWGKERMGWELGDVGEGQSGSQGDVGAGWGGSPGVGGGERGGLAQATPPHMGGVSRGVGGARGRAGVVLSAQARRFSPQRSVPAVPGPTRVRRREGGRWVREVRTVVRADGLRLRRGAWGGRLRVRSGPAHAAPPPPPPRRGPSRHRMGAPLEGPERTRRKCGDFGGKPRSLRGLRPRRRRGGSTASRT